MTRLVACRFEITLTCLELDENGEPVNEYPQQPEVVFGIAAMRAWLERLPGEIKKAETQLAPPLGGRALLDRARDQTLRGGTDGLGASQETRR